MTRVGCPATLDGNACVLREGHAQEHVDTGSGIAWEDDFDPNPCGLCGLREARPGFTACGVCA